MFHAAELFGQNVRLFLIEADRREDSDGYKVVNCTRAQPVSHRFGRLARSKVISVTVHPKCIGGGVDVDYRPRRRAVGLYLHVWRFLGQRMGMVQGAAQFCRKDVFEQLGGYDENVWIGEDVDFYWSLKRLAKATDRTVRTIEHPRVRPSCRRFDTWPVWRILIWTNPLFIVLFRRWKAVWSGWYSNAVR